MASARFDVVVVGAGFAGAVMAERLATAGRTVLVIDRRSHIGGNAFDERDEHGVVVHRYGPHIFHTGSDEVFSYLSRFTAWRPYEHRVRASHRGELFPIPINLETLERFFRTTLDPSAGAALLERLRERIAEPRTSREVVVGAVGEELYRAFFRGYTRKQWGRDPEQLDAQVAARIPVRLDRDDRYFTDRHQAMPASGYAGLFARLLEHPRITVEVGTAYDQARHRALAPHLVWCGPLDEFYGRRFGALPYRSLRFEREHHPGADLVQPVATINHPDEAVPFTRVTECKRITGQRIAGTTLIREFPQAEGEPYYPVPAPDARAIADRYRELSEREPGVTFVGRLAQYRYYNMDQVVGAALAKAAKLLGARP
jgi:UDP-galactopyranose mutase